MNYLLNSTKKFQLFLLMGISSLFCLVLLSIRLHLIDFDYVEVATNRDLWWKGGEPTFIFLVWNLFLAWIPYCVAMAIPKVFKFSKSKLLVIILILTWLLFFPNAHYLITDLLHLKRRAIIPYWFEIMMFVSFAWTGILLGFLSLLEIHDFLRTHLPKFGANLLVFLFIQLAGLGIYMGRFQRWNSWDIITDPFAMIMQVGYTLFHPFEFAETLGIAIVMSTFMCIGYLTVFVLRGCVSGPEVQTK